MSYRINDIFYSLQGEGNHTGKAAVFVRFSGCNLHCAWCDTDHKAFKEMTVDEIISECRRYPARFIVLTGGEPALQVDDKLIEALHKNEYTVAIETNGTQELPSDIDWITCSPKENSLVVLTQADEVKIVYLGQNIEHWRNQIKAKYYMLQPCSQQNTDVVIDYILKHPDWRLSIQTHKILDIK